MDEFGKITNTRGTVWIRCCEQIGSVKICGSCFQVAAWGHEDACPYLHEHCI